MKRIIKRWEQLLISIIINGYIFIISSYRINKRTYLYNEDLVAWAHNYFVYWYFVIWLFHIRLIIIELLVYKRINFKEVIRLYTPSKKIQLLKLIIVLLGHILYWILLYNNIFYGIIIITSILFVISPTILNKSIYESEDYLIVSGIKYFYSDIKDYKEDFGYMVEVSIKGKTKHIHCGNAKSYDIVCKRLMSKVVSTNDCT